MTLSRFCTTSTALLLIAVGLSGCDTKSPTITSTNDQTKAQKQQVPHDSIEKAGRVVWESKSLSPSLLDIGPNSNIETKEDHSIHFGSGKQVPHVYEFFKKWGMFQTKGIDSSDEFKHVILQMDTEMKDPKDKMIVEFSTSLDDDDWTEFKPLGEGVSDFVLLRPARYFKLRITMLSVNAEHTMFIRNIGLQLLSK